MKIKLLVLLVFWQTLFFAQHVNSQSFCGNSGGFTITPAEGCAPLTVNVKNQVNKPESLTYAYEFDRNQATPPQAGSTSPDSSYIYNLPGTYPILQFGSAGGIGFSQCDDVVVHETRAPGADLLACPNGSVRVTLIGDSITKAYDLVEINWGDGSPAATWKNGDALFLDHTYSGGNRPAISIRGRYNNGQCDQSLNTTTLSSNTPPASLESIRIQSVEMLANGEARLLYQGMEGITTRVLIDKGAGQFEETGITGQTGGAQAVTISGLDPKKVYNFRLSSVDICGTETPSPMVSSMVITPGAYSLDEVNSVTWEPYPKSEDVLQYQLLRDGVVLFISSNDLSYLDTDVQCGTTYQYVVVAIVKNDVRSYSAPISMQPKSASPEVIGIASVTVSDPNRIVTQVDLSGEGLTSTYDLIVERADLGSTNFQQVSNPGNQSLQFDDTNVNTTQNSYCYRFQYQNACNQKAPDFSQPVCSVLLKTNAQELVWNADSPFIQGVEGYDLIQMDIQGNVQDEISKQLNTSHPLNIESQAENSFQVKATSGGLTSYSNVLHFKRESIVLVPDIFTPNGDAYNERFEVKAYFVSAFRMSVFNRWGQVVFYSDNMANSWDGNTSGGKAPGGYYIYKVEVTDSFGKSTSKNGSFLLVR